MYALSIRQSSLRKGFNATAGERAHTGEHEHRSPGFSLVTSHLRNEQKQNVLELGSATTPNIEFLSELQCKVYVERLAGPLGELNTPPDEAGNDVAAAALDQLFPYADGTRFDVILAWDLLNYMESAPLEALVARLGQFCKRGTLLFALVRTGKQMPDEPLVFKIVAEDRLRYDVTAANVRRCPQYGTPILLKKMPTFSVLRSFLLQNNVQEYVFKFS